MKYYCMSKIGLSLHCTAFQDMEVVFFMGKCTTRALTSITVKGPKRGSGTGEDRKFDRNLKHSDESVFGPSEMFQVSSWIEIGKDISTGRQRMCRNRRYCSPTPTVWSTRT